MTTLCFFAAMGLPGLAGFVSEAMTLYGAFTRGRSHLQDLRRALDDRVRVLTAAFLLWAMQRVFLGDLNEKYKDYKDMTRSRGLLPGCRSCSCVCCSACSRTCCSTGWSRASFSSSNSSGPKADPTRTDPVENSYITEPRAHRARARPDPPFAGGPRVGPYEEGARLASGRLLVSGGPRASSATCSSISGPACATPASARRRPPSSE